MAERIGQRAFEWVVIAVTAAIVSHLPHLPLWLPAGAGLLIGLRVWSRRRHPRAVPIAIRLPAAALLLTAVIIQYGTVFGREPGSVLGCGLLALKLLETERVRDARVAVGFAGFVLMSALLFVQTLAFTLAISMMLVLLLAALISLQPAPADLSHRLRAEIRLAAILLGVGLPLAAAGFVLIPRLSTPLWGTDKDTQARTGLSDEMDPGSLTDLLTDDTPAFRVTFDGPPPSSAQRYFRAVVLWDFDGRTWTRGRRSDFLRPERVDANGPSIGQTITLEPTDRRWLPALDLPIEAPGDARLGADHVAIADDPVTRVREYRVRSALRYSLAPKLSTAERRRALALPEGFDPESRALAESWRAQGRNDAGVVRAALGLYRESFTYSLNAPLLGRDSVDDFLFSTRKGFCEHYSSSFVFLMRAAGIPARVVTGYQGGWWNRNGDYLLMLNSDAHAWAEVWMKDRGWVRVDPTAAVSPARIELGAAAANGAAAWSQSPWLRALRNRFDIVNRLWTRAVVRFDALRQKGMLTPFGVNNANQGDLLIAFSIVLGIALLVATLWALRDAAARQAGDALDRAWSRLRRRLARAGLASRSSEGPLDLLDRARDSLPASAPSLSELVRDYVSLRYGAREPAPERVRSFTRAVRNFRVRRDVRRTAGAL